MKFLVVYSYNLLVLKINFICILIYLLLLLNIVSKIMILLYFWFLLWWVFINVRLYFNVFYMVKNKKRVREREN